MDKILDIDNVDLKIISLLNDDANTLYRNSQSLCPQHRSRKDET